MTFKASSYPISENFHRIQTIDMHTGGEPLRVILDGFPKPKGNSVLDYRRYIKTHYDHLRTSLMFEPRGHADMYGVVVTESKVADFGVVFLHNEGYSTMCGHATIAIAKLAVESGWVPKVEPETHLTIEAPCGLLNAYVAVENGEVGAIRFTNVPSFVEALDQTVDLPGVGEISYDLAYGGAYYAFVNAKEVGLSCTPDHFAQLIQMGKDIKQAVNHHHQVQHPIEEDLSFLYGTIFIDNSPTLGVHSRNACIFAEGELDRSPTGSGVSARAAIHHRRGEIGTNELIRIESILGTTFDVKVLEEVDFAGKQAVIPEVYGAAYVTGKNEFLIDPNDPLKEGFILR